MGYYRDNDRDYIGNHGAPKHYPPNIDKKVLSGRGGRIREYDRLGRPYDPNGFDNYTDTVNTYHLRKRGDDDEDYDEEDFDDGRDIVFEGYPSGNQSSRGQGSRETRSRPQSREMTEQTAIQRRYNGRNASLERLPGLGSDETRRHSAAMTAKKRRAEYEARRKKKQKTAMIITCSVLFVLCGSFLIFRGWWNSKLELITRTAADDFEVIDSLDAQTLADEQVLLAEMGGEVDNNPQAVVGAQSVQSNEQITNILLVGTDNKTWANSRSDSMILVSLNSKTKKIKMCSFLRDTYCDFPDYKGKSYSDQKLTHAFSYGGAGFCIATIEKNFGINIDNYVRVNFSSFPKVIDSLGGVKLTLTKAEAKAINEVTMTKPNASERDRAVAGTHIVNGEVALHYSRIRKIDTDFRRTQRQQAVLRSIAEAAKDASFSEINSAVGRICSMIQTDLTDAQITSLTAGMLSYLANLDQLEMATFPEENAFEGKIINGMWVAVTDMPSTAASVQNFIYG